MTLIFAPPVVVKSLLFLVCVGSAHDERFCPMLCGIGAVCPFLYDNILGVKIIVLNNVNI